MHPHVAPGPVEGSTGIGQFRKPLVHLVVLSASDNRINQYSKNICQLLLSKGIDVFYNVGIFYYANLTFVLYIIPYPFLSQSDLKENGLSDSSGAYYQYITADHLPKIFEQSHADFIIVVNDKSMLKGCCQVWIVPKILHSLR